MRNVLSMSCSEVSTYFDRIFNTINTAECVTVVTWKSSRHYDEKLFA